MKNPFEYSLDNKRYHTFNYYLKNKYQEKLAKITIDANFSCPNRDGTISRNGCIFCSEKGSGDHTDNRLDIMEQYNQNYALMKRKWPNAYAMPYFQAFSNTYGPLSKIKNMVEPFLNLDEVKALSIATRCDCLDDEKIAYLNSLCQYKDIWLELGLQTSNDKTAKFINRGHTFKQFKDTLLKLKDTDINVCVHIINGLPFESEEDMIQTIKDLSQLPFQALKIHMLYVIKNTLMEYIYKKYDLKSLTKEEYIDIVIKQLELINPKIVIERITGDPVKEDLVTPNWLLNKTQLLNDIDKRMVELDTYQGKKYVQY